MKNSKGKIGKAILTIINDFRSYPDKYLTESDVRCRLINELMKIKEFNKVQKTQDGSKSIPIHSEVRWYGTENKLRWRSDVVIINVGNLRVREDSGFKLPSKGFGFNAFKAVIEIKLRRVNGDPDKKFIEKIKQDVQKLKGIKEKCNGNFLCYLVICDKKGDIEASLPAVGNELELNYQGIKCIKK